MVKRKKSLNTKKNIRKKERFLSLLIHPEMSARFPDLAFHSGLNND